VLEHPRPQGHLDLEQHLAAELAVGSALVIVDDVVGSCCEEAQGQENPYEDPGGTSLGMGGHDGMMGRRHYACQTPLPMVCPSPARRIDLHGLTPEDALRRLEQELHAARVRGERELLLITGRGWGNREQKPILRGRVEAWLRGPGGQRYGFRSLERASRGGALRVFLMGR